MRCWLALCVALGCGGGGHGGGGDGGNGGSQPRLRTSIDLTGVIGFAVAAATSPRLEAPALDAGPCGASTLYALQANGDMVVTTVTETPAMGDAGATCNSSMMREEADKVFDTPGYDVISYTGTGITDCQPGQGAGGAPCNNCGFVVLRKSDGALFCGTSNRVMRVSGSHDKLYLGYPLTRLDMTSNPPTSTLVDDDHITMDSFQTFDVDASDNALGAGNFGVRMFLASGGLINVDAMQEAFQWTDPAGSLFYSRGQGRFQTFQLAPGTYASTMVGSFAQATTVGFAMATATQAYEWVSFGGDSEIVDLMPSAAGGVCMNMSGPATACANDTPCMGTCVGSTVKTCSGGPNNGQACLTDNECSFQCSLGGARHVITGLPMVRQAVGTGDQMYVLGADNAGNGTILGIQPSAIAETACQLTSPTCPNAGGTCCSSPITPAVLIAPGDYSLSAISLSRGGELTFAGLRNADGAHVVGNCTAGGCSVINATAPVVTTLQRIN